MKEKKLDTIIENQIKNFNITADLEEPIMKQIASFENKRLKTMYYIEIVTTIFTSITSIISIFLLNYLFKSYEIFFQLCHINITAVKSFSQGFFIFILLIMGGLIIYLKRDDKKQNENYLIL